MKSLLCLCLALLVPALCRGEGVSLADSPDWQGLPPAQQELLLKQVGSSRVLSPEQKETIANAINKATLRLVDASKYSGGGFALSVVASPGVEIKKNFYERETTDFIQGVTSMGATVSDRQPADVGSLPGSSFIFQQKANGRDLFAVGYVLFAKHEMYGIYIYQPTPVSRTDPVVTSYLSRITVDPASVPEGGGLANLSVPTMASLNSYHLGRFSGTDLLVLGGAVVLIALIAKFVPGR